MIDYLDNTCAVRQRRQRVTEKEELNVIASANYGAAEQPEKKGGDCSCKAGGEGEGEKGSEQKNCSESSVRNRWNFQSILKVNHVGLSRKWNQVQDMTEESVREKGTESGRKTDSIAGVEVNAAAKSRSKAGCEGSSERTVE